MRFRVIPAQHLRTAEPEGVMAADDGEIICELVSAKDREVGKENVGSEIVNETRDLKSHLSWFIGDHVKAVVIPLHASFILRGWGKLVIPGGLHIAVIGVRRTAR